MLNKSSPLLSIAIPTHNRQMYAYYAIRSILSIDDNRIELVVTDTSGDNKLYEMLNEIALTGDKRLKFFRPEKKLDMTGNHNYVISKTTGEYVCLIGDDDTITEDAVVASQWALDNNIDIIAPSVVSNYAWPDFRSIHFGDGHSSRLYIPKKIGSIKFNSSAEAYKKALSNAAQGTDGLPKIYHGIVRRSVLQKIKNIAGEYFFGSSPDVSGAVGLALCSSSFVTVDYPLTIPGASGGSNTGRSALNQHTGKLSQESQTKTFANKGWSLGVPKFFSVETVWAHAAIETFEKISPDSILSFNFCRLLAICLIKHPEYRSEIEDAISESMQILNKSRFEIKKQIQIESIRFRLKRIAYLSKRVLRPTASGGRLFIAGLETIEVTPIALKKYMKKNGWSWTQFLNSNSIGIK